MANRKHPMKASQRFAEMLQRAEGSETFQLEGIKVEIAEQIYLAMERQLVNKAELARRLGKSPAYVTKVLQGTTNFTLESLVRIARALSCQIELTLKATPHTGKRKHLPKRAAVQASSTSLSKTGKKSKSPRPTRQQRQDGGGIG
jgi:transcriptional regulator with XRE-family HTH domain